MIIKKEIYPKVKENTYLLNFDSNFENYCFVNFENLNELKSFIKEHKLLVLYNEWLDFIGNSCYVCESYEEIGSYQLAKVIKVKAETIKIEIIESKSTKKKTINFTKVKKSLELALKDYDIIVILEIAENKEDGWSNGCESLNGLDKDTIEFVYKQLNR